MKAIKLPETTTLRVVRDDVHIMSMNEIDAILQRNNNRESWQELQNIRIAELQSLVNMLENEFLTTKENKGKDFDRERLSLLNLLSVYYSKINALTNSRTTVVSVFSNL